MSTTLILLLSDLTQFFGGSLGWAIVALSLSIRVLLLPVTISLARRSLRNQRLMLSLKPEIDGVKKRFEKDPQKLFAEVQKVYKARGCSPFDVRVLLGSFIQLPIFSLLYGAIRTSVAAGGRFFWIRNLASPDATLILLVLTIAGASAYFLPNASESAKSAIVFMQVVVTCFIVWKLAAGLGLYWAASGLVGLGQNLWMNNLQKKAEMA